MAFAVLACTNAYLCDLRDKVWMGLRLLLTMTVTVRRPSFEWSQLRRDYKWVPVFLAGVVLAVAISESIIRPHRNAAVGQCLDLVMLAVVSGALRTALLMGRNQDDKASR